MTHRPCQHYDGAAQCPLEGVQIRLRCPAGRPDAVAAYCAEHGGEARARAVARADWNYLAPESVGGARAVEDAGCQQLQTPEAYVVLRQTPESQGGTWLAWLGLGSLLTPVANPEPQVRLRANGQPRVRGGRRHRSGRDGHSRSSGASSFPSRELALTAAEAAWSQRLAARVAEIRAARGGTLDWGTPVEPLEAPVVILLEQGDSRSAWDVAITLPRRSPAGASAITGLRPSGECA